MRVKSWLIRADRNLLQPHPEGAPRWTTRSMGILRALFVVAGTLALALLASGASRPLGAVDEELTAPATVPSDRSIPPLTESRLDAPDVAQGDGSDDLPSRRASELA